MRRPLLPLLLLSSLVLSACAGDPSTVAEPPEQATPTAGASAPAGDRTADIEGLEVETEELSREHREGALSYDRVPPVGGPHNPRWLSCDVYDEPVPLETAVHSLEHGAVWFAHDPDLAQDEVDRLAELAGRNREYVLVSPVPDLDAPVVAVAWGVSLEVDDADDERLAAFLERYAGGDQGGEPGAPCRGGGVTLREAKGLVQTPA
jgi:hypothetical protein